MNSAIFGMWLYRYVYSTDNLYTNNSKFMLVRTNDIQKCKRYDEIGSPVKDRGKRDGPPPHRGREDFTQNQPGHCKDNQPVLMINHQYALTE